MKTLTLLLSVLLFASTSFGAAAIAPAVDPPKPAQTEPATLKEAINKDTAEYSRRMYNQFLEKTFHWLDKAENVADKGGEFVAEQAPLVCNEIVAWGRLEYGVFVAFGIGLAFWGLILFRKSIKDKERKWLFNANENDPRKSADWNPSWRVGRLIIGAGCTIAGTVVFFCYIHGFALALVAPRLFILQQIRDLLQGVQGS